MTEAKVCVAGCGRRGIRILDRMSGIEELYVVGAHDINSSKKSEVEKYHVKWFDSYDDLLKVDGLDAVIIATSPSSHFQLAKLALEEGKHVLVEKPSTLSYKNDCTLENLSISQGRLVVVGFSERCGPVVKEAKRKIDFSDIHLYTSDRFNWPQPKGEDPGLEWDLITHDIDLGYYYFKKIPKFVSIRRDKNKSFLQLVYDKTDAQLNARLIPNMQYRYRVARLFGTEKFYFLDYAQQEFHEFRSPRIPEDLKSQFHKLSYREFQDVSRIVENKFTYEKDEPIVKMLKRFISSVQKGKIEKPLCSISDSKFITKTVEDALQSLQTLDKWKKIT